MKSESVLEMLKDLFGRYDGIEKAVLFGSRARGDHHSTSDYDVAVFGELSQADRNALRYSCREEIPTLLKIDLIFMSDTLEDKFILSINREGIVIYDKTQQ